MSVYSERDLAMLRDRIARAKLERERQQRPVVTDPKFRVRYETAEERVEARRRTWNESKKRLHGTCPECGGRKAAHPSVRVCRACYLAASEPQHGSVARYVSRRFRCRCVECREAASAYHRDRRRQMREWRTAA